MNTQVNDKGVAVLIEVNEDRLDAHNSGELKTQMLSFFVRISWPMCCPGWVWLKTTISQRSLSRMICGMGRSTVGFVLGSILSQRFGLNSEKWGQHEK